MKLKNTTNKKLLIFEIESRTHNGKPNQGHTQGPLNVANKQQPNGRVFVDTDKQFSKSANSAKQHLSAICERAVITFNIWKLC